VLLCAVGADRQDTQHSRRLTAVDWSQHWSVCVHSFYFVICSSCVWSNYSSVQGGRYLHLHSWNSQEEHMLYHCWNSQEAWQEKR